jgi:glutathione synthase/RimK-type ligase-like ATP-grasp enzyme
MGKFGLLFGSLDFILTPSGEYVFLEINPVGEWGMLEKDLDLPIASAIADALLQRKNE